jgi:8-oxo-dGTP pyrophosphatase MutT (NUDIX family)
MDGGPLTRLRRELVALTPGQVDEAWLEAAYPGARRAAVLVLFYPRFGQSHLVLTRRTSQLSLHSGQISLPGGRIDPLDFSAAEAALRETREELGVAVDGLQLFGPLMAKYEPVEPHYVQVSNSLLLPFVAFGDHTPTFIANPAEVAEVIELPLDHLLDAASAQEERWFRRGAWHRVGFYRFGKHKIWGATARVLRQIVGLAGGPTPPPDLVAPGEVEPELTPARPAF